MLSAPNPKRQKLDHPTNAPSSYPLGAGAAIDFLPKLIGAGLPVGHLNGLPIEKFSHEHHSLDLFVKLCQNLDGWQAADPAKRLDAAIGLMINCVLCGTDRYAIQGSLVLMRAGVLPRQDFPGHETGETLAHLLARAGSEPPDVDSWSGEIQNAPISLVDRFRLLAKYDIPLDRGAPEVPSPLARAVMVDNAETLTAMLTAEGPRLNLCANSDRSTLLHEAVRLGNAGVSEVLIKSSLDLTNRGNQEGNTALHIAARADQAVCIRLLIDGGATQYGNIHGRSALHEAAANGCVNAVQALLECGARIHAVDGKGNTALLLAARHGCIKAVNVLLNAGIDPNKPNTEGRTALHYAASKGDMESLEALLAASGIDLKFADSDGMTPLHLAAKDGRAAAVKKLLDAGADVQKVNNEDDPPLYLAARHGCTKTVKVLLDAKAEHVATWLVDDGIVETTASSLNIAAGAGHEAVVKLLLARGAEQYLNGIPDVESVPPIIDAVRNQRFEALLVLLKASNIDPNKRHPHEYRTALHYAASEGDVRLLEALLAARGIDLESADFDGMTPLHLAAQAGWQEGIKKLLTAGSSIDAVNKMGRTALHLAEMADERDTYSLLISLGADSSKPDALGVTPKDLFWLRNEPLNLG